MIKSVPMDKTDLTLQKSDEIHQLVCEMKSLEARCNELGETYSSLKSISLERRFIRKKLIGLTKKTRKYAGKIAKLFGECSMETVKKMEGEIEVLEHQISKRKTVLDFREEINKKSERQ